jgi:hypothetical protein
LCYADEETNSDMLKEELYIDYDCEINLVTEGETASEESSNKKSLSLSL